MNKTEKALSLFSNNFNCSQAVFTAFAGDFGIDEKLHLCWEHLSAEKQETERYAVLFRERCLC